MAVFNKLNGFVEHIAEKVHDLGADQLAVALSNTAPSSEATNPNSSTTACILGNVSQISYTNLSGATPRNVTRISSAQTSGTYKLDLTDLTLTAGAGSVGPFRYIYLYNDTPTSPADPLIGYYDYGSALTLNAGESLTIDFDNVSGALTIA